ncbi:MAG: hypothetical protein WAL67_09275 [Candidatus Cybelea sp.]
MRKRDFEVFRYRGRLGQSQPEEPNAIRNVETRRIGDAVDKNGREVAIVPTGFEGRVPPFGDAGELGYVFTRQPRNPTSMRALETTSPGCRRVGRAIRNDRKSAWLA